MAKNLIGTGQENIKKLRKIKKKRTNLTKFSYLFVFLTTICQHNTILGFFFFSWLASTENTAVLYTILASKRLSLTKRKNKLLLWRWLENWRNTSEQNLGMRQTRLPINFS